MKTALKKIVLIEFPIKARELLCIGLYKPLSQNKKNCLDNLSLKQANLSI